MVPPSQNCSDFLAQNFFNKGKKKIFLDKNHQDFAKAI